VSGTWKYDEPEVENVTRGRTDDREAVNIWLMLNVTWRRFDQSAKQLIVGHTTMVYDLSYHHCRHNARDTSVKVGHEVIILYFLFHFRWKQNVALLQDLRYSNTSQFGFVVATRVPWTINDEVVTVT